MPALTPVRRPLCLVLLATQLLTGCTSWKMETIPLPSRFGADPPSTIRLWLADSSRVEIRDARWANDSVSGTLASSIPEGTSRTRTSGQPISVPAADVTGYATRRPSTGKTLGLVAGLVLAGVVVLGAAVQLEPCTPGC